MEKRAISIRIAMKFGLEYKLHHSQKSPYTSL